MNKSSLLRDLVSTIAKVQSTKYSNILSSLHNRILKPNTTMAGYGNRTAPDYVAENLQEEHTSTRLGLTDSNAAYSNAHEQHGSGTTGGAGFGTSSTYLNPPHSLTTTTLKPPTSPSLTQPYRTSIPLTLPKATNAPPSPPQRPAPPKKNSASAPTKTQRPTRTPRRTAAGPRAARASATRRGVLARRRILPLARCWRRRGM